VLSPQYFSYIVAVSCIGERTRSTRRKPPTCRKSLSNFITWCSVEYTSPERVRFRKKYQL